MDDTIVAIATPKGYGGVGVVRVSGPKAPQIAKAICGFLPSARQATLASFKGAGKEILDTGIALYFENPASFTGEDVLELQGHGGPCVLGAIVNAVVQLGARPANPGEFSLRAFLNGKIDLLQAEAIADLIHAKTERAALSASKALSQQLTKKITAFSESLLSIRVYVEACIDFPDEDIELITEGRIKETLDTLMLDIQGLLKQANQGKILRDGLTVALVGEPNVGKSSLFNALLGEPRAIVSDIEGTTRDVLREHIQVNGYPITLLDTAGVRENAGLIEQEGILRSHQACQEVDHILLVIDASKSALSEQESKLLADFAGKITLIANKRDKAKHILHPSSLMISATKGEGLDDLLGCIEQLVGHQDEETPVVSRARHIHILEQTFAALTAAQQAICSRALECAAQDLKIAHDKLGEMTGRISSDALLGEIFSSFCIGK